MESLAFGTPPCAHKFLGWRSFERREGSRVKLASALGILLFSVEESFVRRDLRHLPDASPVDAECKGCCLCLRDFSP